MVLGRYSPLSTKTLRSVCRVPSLANNEFEQGRFRTESEDTYVRRSRPGRAADTELGFGKYRAAGGLEARLFFAMLACMANAADHKIVQRDCISFRRTDMIIAIACARLVEACQLKRRGMVR